ncbi:MAG: hypothetical protein P4L99_28450 [Chthoniobacter sp.]|nr:hypothetical protein [Chthoniobacter sp.]
MTVVRPKMDWLARHGDEFDLLVIGSSRVQHQFIPALFDHVAAENGRPVRSGNMGIAAMFPPEDAYLLEQILRRPHRRLRWVLIELSQFTQQVDQSIGASNRMDYWHDSRRMWLFTRRSVADFQNTDWKRADSVEKRTELFSKLLTNWSSNFGAFLRRSTNLGLGAQLLTERLGDRKRHSKFDNGGPKGDGWVDPGEGEPMDAGMRADYDRDFAALRATSRGHLEDPVAETSLRGSIERLRAEGIEPILFLPPGLDRTQFWPQRLLESVTLLDISEPERYPALYDPANRREGTHLNLPGSALYTRELALRFIEHTRGLPR